MAVATLSIQRFDNLESIRFEPEGTTRIGVAEWQVDPYDAFDVLTELSAIDYEECFERHEEDGRTLVRRFKGALYKVLKDAEGWQYVTRQNTPAVVQCVGRDRVSLSDYGLMLIRFSTKPDPQNKSPFVHTSIDLRFSDGTTIIVPSEARVLWSKETFVIQHLNDINFGGGGWMDHSSSKALDHLFSHGH